MKTNMALFKRAALLVLLSTLSSSLSTALAQTTAFTYQGQLKDANGPANGLFDFQFELHAASTGYLPVGTPIITPRVPVTNGLFTVTLNFPELNNFNGADRWLQITVKPGGVPTPYTLLSPRQQITSAPYAIRAGSAGSATTAQSVVGPVPASQITGTISTANLPPINQGAPPLAPGGIVLSDDPANAALAAQGFARMPNAEMTLATEAWTRKRSHAASVEFLSPIDSELSLNTGSELLVFGFLTFPHKLFNRVNRYNPATGQWTRGATPPIDVCGPGATAVWTGTDVLLWGGEYTYQGSSPFGGLTYFTDNAPPAKVLKYSPATDQWTVLVGTGAIPTGRDMHTACWTGSRMLIWGGQTAVRVGGAINNSHDDLSTGAMFDPATGIWTAMSASGAPSKRRGHVTAWTGSQMLIQGGMVDNRSDAVGTPVFSSNNVLADGAAYNPATGTWSPIRSDGSAPRVAFANSVWTGSEMFVSGGYTYSTAPEFTGLLPANGNFTYRPADNSWLFRGVDEDSAQPVVGRANGGIAWNGTEVMVWGGAGRLPGNSYTIVSRKDGRAYNLGTATWRLLPAAPQEIPAATSPNVAWLNNQLVVVVGTNAAGYRPAGNSWVLLNNFYGAPPLYPLQPSAVWTGTELLIWGGMVSGMPSSRGWRYNPITDHWAEMSTTNAPAARTRHSAVWTGSRMVVWGGDGGGDPIYPAVVHASGGAYDPVTDTWTPLPATPIDPSTGSTLARTGHKAVWTAAGMVMVGGSDGYNNQGQNFPRSIARLSPNLASWTLAANVPGTVGRYDHCLGTDSDRTVFLWGGQDQVDFDPIDNGTFLIDAFTLTAIEMDSADQPLPSRNPSIVWSGKEFIAWGGTWTDGTPLGGGSKFNPDETVMYWTPLSVGGPVITTTHAGHTATWSGTEMLLCGGNTNAFGARYNPRSDAWTPMTVGPVMRAGGKSVWTGTNMLLYLPPLPTQGAIPELWQYQPPLKSYFYLKL